MLFKFVLKDMKGNIHRKVVNCSDGENIGNYKRVNIYLWADSHIVGDFLLSMSYSTETRTFLQFARRCQLWSVREWITREFFNKHYKPAKFLAYPEAGKVFRQLINEAKQQETIKLFKRKRQKK